VASEALSALVLLGFNKASSDKVVKAILKEEPNCTLENLIKLSLKRL
jgi:Holliday junction DNA helicase RuvA